MSQPTGCAWWTPAPPGRGVAVVPPVLLTGWIHLTSLGHWADPALIAVLVAAVAGHLAVTHRRLVVVPQHLMFLQMLAAVMLYTVAVVTVVALAVVLAA